MGLGSALLLGCTALASLGAPQPPSAPQAGRPDLVLQAGQEPDPPSPEEEEDETEPPRAEPSAEPPAPRRTATLVMGGDLLWHDTVWLSAREEARRGQPYDFDPMFASLRPLIRRADASVCHTEVPFAGPGQSLQSYPVFAAPPEIAPWIASMGFDACTTASNHTVDQGFEGLVRTADLLKGNGVQHVGTFRTERERRRPVIVETDEGVRIGIVAGTYGLNGFALPEGRPWSVSLWDAPNLLSQARRARRAGADVVVVHLHGGNEYDPLPNADQVALVEKLTASPDVDLVLGEHAHVVQPITRVNGKWVVYGMGNMIAQQDTAQPRTYEGITVEFEFTQRPRGGFEVTEAAYVPTYWSHWSPGSPIRIQRVTQGLAKGYGDQARLREALTEIRAAVNGLGRTPGLVER